METIFGIDHQSCSLPQVKGENSQTRPDSGPCRTFRQHSTQTKLAFEHTDRRFYAAAKPLQLTEPFLSLMPLFFSAQATHFRDADFFNTRLAKLQHIIHTVVAPIRGELFRLYTEIGFRLAQQRKQFRAVVGITAMNL